MTSRALFLFSRIDRMSFCGIKNSLRAGSCCNRTAAVKYHSSFPWKNLQLNEIRLLHAPEFSRVQFADKNISTSQVLMEKSGIQLSRKELLKKAVKDYGSTVIIFHVTISLASLGFFYLLVSSGIDMQQIMNYIGINFKFAENAGTFVTAYAIHKLFAPVRISITLGATPFIVRYLRNKGILKKPK